MRIERYFDEVARKGIHEALGVEGAALLKPTQDAKNGDYQVNGAMALAKAQKANPKDLADKNCDAVASPPGHRERRGCRPRLCELRLSSGWLGETLKGWLADERDGVPVVDKKERIVVDYSSPNISKQMHVGHLRSTIIGNAIVSMLRFIGHDVDERQPTSATGARSSACSLPA